MNKFSLISTIVAVAGVLGFALLTHEPSHAEHVLSTDTVTVTTTKRIASIVIDVNDTNQVHVTAHFVALTKDSNGHILHKRHIEQLQIPEAELRQLLPTNSLPDFDTFFAGLSGMLHGVSQGKADGTYTLDDPPAEELIE